MSKKNLLWLGGVLGALAMLNKAADNSGAGPDVTKGLSVGSALCILAAKL